jgi:hypothetical protein
MVLVFRSLCSHKLEHSPLVRMRFERLLWNFVFEYLTNFVGQAWVSWKSAQWQNLAKGKNDFLPTIVIFLEQFGENSVQRVSVRCSIAVVKFVKIDAVQNIQYLRPWMKFFPDFLHQRAAEMFKIRQWICPQKCTSHPEIHENRHNESHTLFKAANALSYYSHLFPVWLRVSKRDLDIPLFGICDFVKIVAGRNLLSLTL